ncbi:unnamed protein product [Nippostrongylus brasiliensis]|uniref:VWFA domain-containing protein n=1 Tax=Nippostrongylus brasiliensis TaxID=27835 RepID=A0A0N4YRD8_NIPBR|nr:unnamed protein product [Nippostrongylus brasiliensis]
MEVQWYLESSTCKCDSTNAEQFSVRVGIQKSFMSWDDQLSDTSSPQYAAAVYNLSLAAVETFVTTLLTYAGNPYSFSPDVSTSAAASGYILVPYPNTAFYSPANQYGVLRESDLNVSLTAYNKLLSIQPEYGATISDAFDFILNVNRRSQFRAVVLVGVSDAFVLQAEKEAAALDAAGYEIFTVSIVSESSSCFYSSLAPPTATPSTIKHTSISPQATTPRYCAAPIIQQDIAFVVEVSTSSGSLDESHAASTFITQYLISQTAFDDQHSNFAIVPFPDPSSYEISGGLQDFGNLQKSEFVITFQMIYSVYPTLNGAVSDINSASGVQAAVDRASQLKADGVVILTVGVGDSDVDLQPLSTSPLDVWNLSTTDVSSYSATAASIISRLSKGKDAGVEQRI